jgi:hypothetical protein
VSDLPKVAMFWRLLSWGLVVADGLMLAAVLGAVALFGRASSSACLDRSSWV